MSIRPPSGGGGTVTETDPVATAALATHTAAADPHTGYQKESEKGAASGYAGLDGSTKLTFSNIPTGTSSTTVAAGDDSRITGAAQKSSNLSDLTSSTTARTNLGLGTAATHPTGDFAQTANNLSDVTASTARTNLGLGTSATHPVADFLQTANNLSDVTATTARTNLGLGTAATQTTGTFLQTANNLSDVTAATARTNLGLFSNPLNTLGDLQIYGNNVASNGSSTGVLTLTGSPYTTETIVSGMDLTVPTVGASVAVVIDLWMSMNQGGGGKTWTARIRRTNLSGTVLASQTFSGSADTSGGHNQEWSTTYTDNSPTDGHYVVTVQGTGGAASPIYSDTRTMTLTGSGNAPTRFGTSGTTINDILVSDSGATAGIAYKSRSTLGIPSTTKTINAQSGTSYTTVLSDAGADKFVTMTNASASTLTIPPNSSVAYAVGSVIEGAQLGAGQVTLTPGSGVTINGTPGLKVAAQYGTFGLIKTATDTWLAYGRLSA